ncbi:alpha/beta hydrolase [Nocardia uniformis]|uniref:Alpha/beta hydrolase n=1 Tax=Nocardia uniformis TaxID=53432 RepID=A0A849BU61_9NOCA|nr:alpha/beta hydrolase [Nocardia uniformis]
MLPVEDTELAVIDTGGPGTPVVYLNGAFASQKHWRRVIADLGPGYRHITYDEQACGASKRSVDYSFEAAVRDLDAVLTATGVARPLLAGWSYGALLGVHWADRRPNRPALANAETAGFQRFQRGQHRPSIRSDFELCYDI